MPTTQEHKDHHIAQWQASRLSRAAYCRHAGLPYQQFRSWMQHAAGGNAVAPAVQSGFFEIPTLRALASTSTASISSPVSIVLPCGISLQVQSGTDPVWFGRLVAGMHPC